MPSSSTKRVTRNALALTFRMILVTLVGLYTSRVILEALGVDDYGIYGVIGGVVGLAGFLNSSMGGATSRFITFELGKGNFDNLKSVFSTSLVIHLLLALLVLVLAETIGLWFVNCKMNFPADRMFAVNVLYQFTILTMIVNFTQVPYTAAIIAHEKMSIYAYIEIINVCLKLGMLYIVILFKTDKLILYAALVFCVSTSIALIYRFYCIRKFPETKVRLKWEKDIMRKMIAFSGFDLYGNMCGAVNYQGLPLILNIFFGVVANAGCTIANSVVVAVKNLTSSISQAFKPQIVKQYAQENIGEMASLMLKANQFTLLAFAAVGIPVFFATPQLLNIWLGQTPLYAVDFLRLVLIATFIEVIMLVNNAGIHATGNVKYISFISGTVYLLGPVLSYILYKVSPFPATLIYYINIGVMTVIAILGWVFLKIQISGFPIRKYSAGILRILASIGIAVTLIVLLRVVYPEEDATGSLWKQLYQIVKVTLISLFFLMACAYLIGFNMQERIAFTSFCKLKLKAAFNKNS